MATLRNYAQRVKSFLVSQAMPVVAIQLIVSLLEPELLPSLTTLSWRSKTLPHLMAIKLFLLPSLQRLHVFFLSPATDDDLSTPLIDHVVELLRTTCPKLTCLYLPGTSLALRSQALESALLKLLPHGFHSLQLLAMPGMPMRPSILVGLSIAKSITELRLS
jgi:hypothetical protein